jgi:hypothetical protein
MARTMNRREWLGQAATVAAVVGGASALLAACRGGGGGGLVCTDTSGLSEADIQTRTANAYVEASTHTGQRCENCALYVAGAAGACGTCQVVKGPINPGGWCNIWVTAG